MKGKLGIILVVFLITSSINIYAQESISSWAIAEVEAAQKEQLVPETLNSNFQSNIKRYEYVLLALEILELNNRAVNEEIQYPFSDIEGHVYEKEIIRAYNAGIIKGDGNGRFYPDRLITREEIASLVCNLVVALDSNTNIDHKTSFNFADQQKISSWSKTYINYCYRENIMKGVGKENNLDKIDPTGYASREQAIILLYRLAVTNQLLRAYNFEPINVVTYSEIGAKSMSPSTLINEFTKNTSENCGKLLIEYSKKSNYEVQTLTGDYFELNHLAFGKMTFMITNNMIQMNLSTKDNSYSELIDTFLSFLQLYSNSELAEQEIRRAILGFSHDKSYYFNEILTENVKMLITYNEDNSTYQYKIVIDQRL